MDSCSRIDDFGDCQRLVERYSKNKFVSSEIIGKSPQNRSFQCLRIGEDKSDSKIMMVIGRLHPPEVTGQFALQAFVESLCMDSETAKKFRKEYTVYVVPMMNPDGVDNGHWRHNTGVST